VGLNNIKSNDYMNVVVQILAHIPPIRDYFLLTDLEIFGSELGKRDYLCGVRIDINSPMHSQTFRIADTESLEFTAVQSPS
jgi:hypothetical protein